MNDDACNVHVQKYSDFLKAKNFIAALKELLFVYEKHKTPGITLDIVNLYMELNEQEKALDYFELFEQMSDLSPEYQKEQKVLLYDMGDIAKNLKRYPEARDYFQRCAGFIECVPVANLYLTVMYELNYIDRIIYCIENPRACEPLPLPPLPSPFLPPPSPSLRTQKVPLYKRWWLWAGVGLVSVGIIAAGLAGSYAVQTSIPDNAAPPYRPF